MKKMFLILATAALSLGSFARNPDDNKGRKNDPDKYCAELKDGYLKIMHNGEALTQNVTLDNGTKIGIDGMVTKVTGETQMLKEGECVNLDGNIETGNVEHKGTGEPDKSKMNKSDKDKMNKPDKEPMKSDKDKMDKEKMDKDMMNRPDKEMDQDKMPRSNPDKSGKYEKNKSAEPSKSEPAKDKDKYEEPK